MKIIPKNWREFQHYKDRNPPWIRLHKKLLDDYDFHLLPVASRALAPMLWLLASDSIDGEIDADPEKLAFRLRTNVSELAEALKPLIDRGFFTSDQDASAVLAECLRDAVPLQRQRHYITETEKTPLVPSAPKPPEEVPAELFPEDKKPKKPAERVDEDFEIAWQLYPKRIGANVKRDALKSWSARRNEGVRAADMIDGVRRYAKHLQANGKSGTEFVMQASRFFGPSKLYAEDWACAPPPIPMNSATSKMVGAETFDRDANFLEEIRHGANWQASH